MYKNLKNLLKIPLDNALLMLFILIVMIYFILTLDERSKKNMIENFEEEQKNEMTEERKNQILEKMTKLQEEINEYENRINELDDSSIELNNKLKTLDEEEDKQEIFKIQQNLFGNKNETITLTDKQNYANSELNDLKAKFPEIYKNNFSENNNNNEEINEDDNENNDKEGKDSTTEVKLNKHTTVVHNHYYGGNKDLTKFLKKLVDNQNKADMTLNTDYNQIADSNIADAEMCREFQKKTSNMSMAEIKNDRILTDLKMKCDRYGYKKDTCKIQPRMDQTALLGTLLTDTTHTNYGSLLPKLKEQNN
jgi:chromosome segregation ATPase